MSLTTFFKLYLVALPVFLIVDLVWLGIVARGFYRSELGHLMRPDINWGAAFLFYAIFVAGIVVFATWPGIERESLLRSILLGAFLGLVAYAAYDLTNLATLAGFPVRMALVDLCWGAVLCGVVSGVTYLAWGWVG
jgi:uncharacterized membrane protein